MICLKVCVKEKATYSGRENLIKRRDEESESLIRTTGTVAEGLRTQLPDRGSFRQAPRGQTYDATLLASTGEPAEIRCPADAYRGRPGRASSYGIYDIETIEKVVKLVVTLEFEIKE